jgi:hypothetical protein
MRGTGLYTPCNARHRIAAKLGVDRRPVFERSGSRLPKDDRKKRRE